MLARNKELEIPEPDWALRCVRRGTCFPFRNIEQAKEMYNHSKMCDHPVAAELAAQAWDRMALREIRKAKTEKDIRTAWVLCRDDSEADTLAARKITRICNGKAFAATTIGEAIDAINGIKPFRRVERKIAKFLAEMRGSAQTMEDFQRLFHYAPMGSALSAWAEENWDRLSKEEVDAATTLKAADKAYWRAHVVNAHGILSWGGGRDEGAKEYAIRKWDALATALLQKAQSREQYYQVMLLSRTDSEPESIAFQEALMYQEDFEATKKLYRLRNERKHHFSIVVKEKTVTQLAELCTTTEQAVELYRHFHVGAHIGKELIKRFPDLVGGY